MSFERVKPVPDKDDKGLVYMTEKYACEISVYNGYYEQPKLNQTLHLHYKGFSKIFNLESFINLRTLYLENNCITKIENLSHMKNLTSL
jgi:dynein assembly factor 1